MRHFPWYAIAPLAAFWPALVLAAADPPAPASPPAPKVGVLEHPCEALTPLPESIAGYLAAVAKARAEGTPPPQPSPEKMAEGMRLYGQWEQTRRAEDFGGRCRYAAENAALPPPSPQRVVLFGDSITELWAQQDPGLFGPQFLDRGISGQTTSQMLVRFHQDVVELEPAVVQILAGTNDIAGNTGPVRLEWIQANIAGMVQLAKAHGIGVVLGSVPPARAFGWRPGIDPRASIEAMNAWLRRHAAEQCLAYVDYHAVLADADGGLRRDYGDDGVHPNAAGYAAMRPLLERALREPPRCGG